MHRRACWLATDGGFRRGELRIGADGRIAALHGEPMQGALRAGEHWLLPGFIDLHVHGGAGADTMDGGDAVAQLARLHARHGTTALLATTMTAPLGEVQAALDALAPHCRQRPAGAARVLGAHLEGPFISPRRLGAQPEHAQPALLDTLRDLLARAPIRVLTLAPEEGEHLALIPWLVEQGVRVQLGHSTASYEQGVAALQAGASGFTHLFNAMSAMQHRAPGLVGAALAHAQHAELIPDLLHVHAGALRVALRAIPGAYAVTDATAAAGMPEGEFALGRQRVFHCAGGVRLADGTLAGSALTMDQALRNLVQIGLPLGEAAQRLSRHAADYLGLQERGRLAVGAWADFVELDADLRLRAVFVEGESIE